MTTGFRSACAKRFSPYSIECGEELASTSRVALVERGPPSFVARVDDESATIVMSPTTKRMFSACTCALFALGLDGCRHIWALVARMDDEGLVTSDMLGEGFSLDARYGATRSWASARRMLDRDEEAIRARHRGRLGRLRARAGPGR